MLHFPRWKIWLIVASCVASLLFLVPNFVGRDTLASMPGWLPHRQLTLGLDLQGGAHLMLEVDTQAMIKERLEVLRDDVRRVLREDRVGYTGIGIQGTTVQVRIPDQAQIEKAATKLATIPQSLSDTVFSGARIVDVEIARDEGGLFRLSLTKPGLDYRTRRVVEQSMEVVRRRVDQLGTTEPIIARQGGTRLLVQVPGLQDIERLKDLLRQTARLTFHMVEGVGPQALGENRSSDTDVLYTRDNPPVPVLIQKRAMLTGEELVDAQASFSSQSSEPVVSFRFNTSGAQKFAQVTQQAVGRPFAIVLDKDVISYPVIREPILGGSGQISGSFSVQSANDLALLLRAGALPADLTIVEERTVGPGLGADSIAAGKLAAGVGTVLVVLYMIGNYGLLGIFADIAVVINIMMLMAILSVLQATLTLPGIAGIVLTIGMAVDANVLIYERIREEQKLGRSPISSIDAGFSRALGTIIDSNLTTLIAAVVMFLLGSGPIKGFAVTLGIGILTTLFTAITVTRLMVAMWLKRFRPTRIPI
ncbi:protein translocase subunit SecD [Siculibacillus lacustris]|uniref:Protein translocase subunit SecD n=1 Tax=Siculibacillus lacustris TaxID=1549641 RepID=A0A4Q9VGW9_9HYPH|nr:protein translocase subunit SecD [Siculibacillus lacustris]TBW34284.1 protein translocase subunit SecD [Siculibacillus lacustris]